MENIFDTILVNGILRSGNTQDNVLIDSDGFIKLSGKAEAYEAFLCPLISAKTDSSNVPSWSILKNGIKAFTFAVGDYLSASTFVPSSYKEHSPVTIFLEWCTNGSESVDKYVKWEIETTSALPDGPFPDTTTTSVEIKIPANTPDRTRIHTPLIQSTGESLIIGCLRYMKLRRIAASGTAPAANPFGLYLGVFYKQNSIGSKKQREKGFNAEV